MTGSDVEGASASAVFDVLFSSPAVALSMSQVAPAFHEAAQEFWRVPFATPHLEARMKELVLFAMHVSAASLNVDAINRQVDRVLAAGGTREEIADVVTTIASLANHSVYASVPVLEEEWAAAGKSAKFQQEEEGLSPEMEAV
jgi:alkylhydroperoxidase/carboxymuconolactone decarboxylase family protein YurZ